MVLLKGSAEEPVGLYTGSTNMSLGGVTGQTNVGHWVKSPDVAAKFRDYWHLLAEDPGSAKGDDRSTSNKKKKAHRDRVEALSAAPASIGEIPEGVTTVFSPRSGLDVLDLYVKLVDEATNVSCVTLAFGVNEMFKEQLKDDTPNSNLVFMLLEKKDEPNKRSKKPFVVINASNNVYKAWGAFLRDPIYQWAKETNNRYLKFNSHVSYVHSKFLLMDPLGAEPIVVTGSANFSAASTNANDENMLIIKGSRRVADIYFTEFNRLFNHYYFRAVHESRNGNGTGADNHKEMEANLFLDETGTEWVKKYEPGKLRAKRLAMYQRMEGFTEL
jgi:phosphatidylserine/phosphatidylglycerophosphate/cardiolipin synthase-like enzyme